LPISPKLTPAPRLGYSSPQVIVCPAVCGGVLGRTRAAVGTDAVSLSGRGGPVGTGRPPPPSKRPGSPETHRGGRTRPTAAAVVRCGMRTPPNPDPPAPAPRGSSALVPLSPVSPDDAPTIITPHKNQPA